MLHAHAGGVRGVRVRAIVGSCVVSLVAGGCLLAVVAGRPDRVNSLSGILAVAAVGAGLLAVNASERVSLSAAFIVYLLAAALLGPASAAAAAVISELSAAVRFRTRLRSVLLINLPTAILPAVIAGLLIRIRTATASDTAGFYLAVVVVGCITFCLSFVTYSSLRRIFQPEDEQYGLRVLIGDLPSAILSVLIAAAGVSITLKVGNGGIAFALAAVLAFSYMSHLLAESRRRAEQYVSLSWGVLAGLMRAIDVRDQRAARHAAAVARFARDMAATVGMDQRQQELAHTAGLLHDIGHFALSDRVHERGRTLNDEDWEGIQRHPESGADMLKDLGMYGPVAEIILAHHERIDGRGYPSGMTGEEIPEIARIIAVAEVYDTLTASDTYRTRMSSFEALRELRRVAGTQLDARYVEVLVSLLSGEGVEYRHADAANFDTELDMERRIKAVRTG